MTAQPKAKLKRLSVSESADPWPRKTRATAEGGTKKARFCRPLPKEFRRDRFTYRQIARDSNAAIYEQTWNGRPNPSVSYEVIRIRHRDGFHIAGRFVDPAEVYPRSEGWDVDGFTVPDKETAFRKLRSFTSLPHAPSKRK